MVGRRWVAATGIDGEAVKAFTVAEANALLTPLEEALTRVDARMKRIEAATGRLQILDVLWGEKLLERRNPDHDEARHLRLEIANLMADIEAIVTREILERGLRFPQGGLEHGLIDFPTTWQGRWVLLCWRRGETSIQAWHELDGGFAGRQPLTREQALSMGTDDLPFEDLDDPTWT
jgi:hypothetical protein